MRIIVSRSNALPVAAVLGARCTVSGCGMPPVTYVKPQLAARAAPVNADVILHLPTSSRSRMLTGSNTAGVITSYKIPTGELLAGLVPDVARDAFRSVELVEDRITPRTSHAPSQRDRTRHSGPRPLRRTHFWTERSQLGRDNKDRSCSRELLAYDTVVTGRAEGRRGPAGGRKQTAQRTGRALQDLHTRSVQALTASKTIEASMTWIPLTLAAMRGDVVKVDSLLATGAPVDVLDPAGRSPLMAAVSRGHVSIAERLLERGAAGAIMRRLPSQRRWASPSPQMPRL